MSQADRNKWDAKYQQGAYSERTHPSAWLVESLSQTGLPGTEHSKALDLACGAGRNALYLAGQGFRVDAVDISSTGLERARQAADDRKLSGTDWIQHDLDDPLPEMLTAYDLIIMIRYLDIGLLCQSAGRLNPGGILLAEVHLQTSAEVAGPASARFRAEPGELEAALAGLKCLAYSESLVTDPDGARVAVARLLARKP